MFRLDSSHPLGASAWSMSPATPELLLTCHQKPGTNAFFCQLRDRSRLVREWSDPLEALAFLQLHLLSLPASATPARWAGYLGFDLGQLFEKLPRRAADDLGLPLFAFGLCRPGHDGPAAYDPAVFAVASADAKQTDNFTAGTFCSAVERGLEYIRAGDIFQVNLAQRLGRPLRSSPENVYSRLLARAPAWYGAHLQFPQGPWGSPFALLSNSPELFLNVRPDRTVTTRPIKGTRPLGGGNAEELLHSEKDKAELAMIVDLHRNDIGRVCQIGTVKVTEPRVIETHPTVYHGVATIEGRLRPNVGFVDILAATFPPGSVTGCPKIRSVEIIDELEPHRRGAYCGAIGYLCQSGQIQFNVAIRTMTIKDGVALVPVGGGIVADSNPQAEYQETLVKARAMLEALDSE